MSDGSLAESMLGDALIGASISGVRFGALQLLFESGRPSVGEPYVNLSSAWTVYPSRPAQFPEDESDIADVSADDELQLVVSLRHKVVASVEVLTPWPHLVLTFADGSLLFLNGKNDRYEPWTAGIAHAPPDRQFQVIACPGGELAFLLPQAKA